MKKWLKYSIITLISALVGAAFAVSTDFNILLRKNDHESYRESDEIRTLLITGSGKCSVILNDEAEPGKGRYVSRLRISLNPREEKPLKLRATVYFAPETKEMLEPLVIEDVNPIYVRQQVFRIDREHVVSVEIESLSGPFTVGDVKVDSSFRWNWTVFLSGMLLCFAVLFAVFGSGRKEPAAKVRRAFPVICLAAGLVLVAALPGGKVGYDEETHLQAVLQLASFPSNELHVSDGVMNQVTVTEYNNPDALPKGAIESSEYEMRLSQDADYKNGARNPEFSVMANRVPAYLPMAAAVKAAKGLGLSWSLLVRAARLANLLTYVLLVTLALWILPDGHLLMALVALFPQNIFLASTVSYDPSVTGFLFLGTAFLLRLLLTEEGTKETVRDTVLALLCMLIGCLPKAVYAPLMLSVVLVPFRRKMDRKKTARYIAAVLLAFAATLCFFILPTVIAPPDTGDIRGGEEVSEMSQVDFILGHPFRYAGILLSQMIRWIPQTMYGPDCTTYMGHLVNGGTAFRGYSAAYLFLLTVLILIGAVSLISGGAERDGTGSLRLYERLFLLFTCFCTSVLIWTAMYVSFTAPGAQEIAGVQGRYFTPLLFTEYYALCGGGKAQLKLPEKLLPKGFSLPEKAVRLVRNRGMWYDCMLVAVAVLTGFSVLRSLILPYCM